MQVREQNITEKQRNGVQISLCDDTEHGLLVYGCFATEIAGSLFTVIVARTLNSTFRHERDERGRGYRCLG